MSRVLSAVTGLVFVWAVAAGAAEYPPPVSAWLAEHQGAEIVGWRQYALFSGAKLWRIKNNQGYVLVNDAGEVAKEPEQIVDEDRAYRHASLGAMTDYLAAGLLAEPNKPVLVSIFPRRMRPPSFSRPLNESEFLQSRDAVLDFCASSEAPILSLLSELNVTPTYVAGSTPFVVAQLTPMQVYAIRFNAHIDVIDNFHDVVSQYAGDNFRASRLIDLGSVQSLSSGQGQVVVAVEKGRIRYGNNNPAEPHNLGTLAVRKCARRESQSRQHRRRL